MYRNICQWTCETQHRYHPSKQAIQNFITEYNIFMCSIYEFNNKSTSWYRFFIFIIIFKRTKIEIITASYSIRYC